MPKVAKYLFGVLFLGMVFSGQAQYYLGGQDPASVHWKQIKTPSATFIFPEEAEAMAQRYANLLQLSNPAIAGPYLAKMRPIDIVLHNRSTLSNAMVSPTPFHADIFLTPDQVTYPQLWSKQLTLHEYRHAVQMQKMRQGFTGGLYYAFGDQTVGALMGLFMPFWFIEGDAVFSETIHSNSGRGRTPSFVMDLKAQVLDKGIYSYDKAQYGSYQDYVPDHYTLGYQLVLNGLLNYDPDIWNYTLEKITRRPYTLMPFSNGIRHFAGTGKAKYYKHTIQQLATKWEQELAGVENQWQIPQPETKEFTNYRFVIPLENGEVLAEKISMDDVNRFVKIDREGHEKRIFTPGYDFAQSLSGNDSLLVWNEKAFDPRWTNRDFSVIKVRYITSGKTRVITRNSKLFAPALSQNALMIAAVKVSNENQYSLTWLNAETGDILGEFRTDDNWFLMFPTWSDDDQSIVMVALGAEGKAIVRYYPETNQHEILIPFGFTDISQPVLFQNKLVFVGAYNGTNNLYQKDLTTGLVSALTQSRYGVTDPRFTRDGDSLFFADYTANGYRLAAISLQDKRFQPIDLNTSKHLWPIDQLVSDHTFNLDEVTIPDTLYQVSHYSRLGHLFNFHSWGLTGVDVDNYSFSPGVNVLSQNVLSTSTAFAGYYYDPNEQTGKIKAGFSYLGWYPEINLSAESGRRKQLYTDNAGIVQEARWRETDVTFGSSVPLNFTNSKWIKGVEPMAGVSAKFLKMDEDVAVRFREDQVISVHPGIFAYIQYKRSLRDLFPRWGQSLQMSYRTTPFSDSVSQQFAAISTTYLPGFFRHHGFRLYTAWQWSENGNYSYSNLVSFPRGYSGLFFNDVLVFKADYAMPVAYPDWDIPSVLYFKRLRANLFWDVASGQDVHHLNQTYESSGVELFSDWHFLGLLPEVTLGVRCYSRSYDKTMGFEFLFGAAF